MIVIVALLALGICTCYLPYMCYKIIKISAPLGVCVSVCIYMYGY